MKRTKYFRFIIISLLSLLISLNSVSFSAFATETGEATFVGGGTQDDPYQIATIDDLNQLASLVNNGMDFVDCFFELTNDINDGFSSPIGQYTVKSRSITDCPFNGTFDGNNHTIHINIQSATNDYVGLFGYIGSEGTVKDLCVDGTINCVRRTVGGICGNNLGIIDYCSNHANVTGSKFVGGICGVSDGMVINSSNYGCITASGASVGGISGYCYYSNRTLNCYNVGSVCGSNNVGGICGMIVSGSVMGNNYLTRIRNCYNIGKISCINSTATTPHIGEICGYNSSSAKDSNGECLLGIVDNCFYIKNSSTNNLAVDGSDTSTAYGLDDATYDSLLKHLNNYLSEKQGTDTVSEDASYLDYNIWKRCKKWITTGNSHPIIDNNLLKTPLNSIFETTPEQNSQPDDSQSNKNIVEQNFNNTDTNEATSTVTEITKTNPKKTKLKKKKNSKKTNKTKKTKTIKKSKKKSKKKTK